MELIQLVSDIIMAAGPYFVFKGMGTGTQSGKLKFKSIIQGNSSIGITETSNSITINSNAGGSGSPIDLDEIAFGTGTGITSSFAAVSSRSIVGVSSFGTLTFSTGWGVCDASGVPSACNSIIITGHPVNNLICSSRNSNIIGSCDSKISFSYESDVIQSSNSCQSNNFMSSIIGVISVTISSSSQSSIIAGYKNSIQFGKNSTILASRNGSMYFFKPTPTAIDPTLLSNSIISTIGSCINTVSTKGGTIVRNNTIISSKEAENIHSNPGCGTGNPYKSSCQKGYISIISSEKSCILGARCGSVKAGGGILGTNDGLGGSNYTGGSDTSVIISSCKALLYDTCRSSILSTHNSSIIVGMTGSNSAFICSNITNSSIISGQNNKISTYQDTEKSSQTLVVCNSGIISSRNISFSSENRFVSVINSASFSFLTSDSTKSSKNARVSIIGVETDTNTLVVQCSSNSAIINSFLTDRGIIGSTNSIIMNSNDVGIITSENSAIMTSQKVALSSSKNSVVISSYDSDILGSNNSALMTGCSNIIFNSSNSSIISGCRNSICDTCNSVILSGASSSIFSCSSTIITGYCNTIATFSHFSTIIGGVKNFIGPKPSDGSTIIGGDNNTICGPTFSAIIGSSGKGLTAIAYSNTLYVSKLIFDLPALIGSSGLTGSTCVMAPSWNFKVERGLVVMT